MLLLLTTSTRDKCYLITTDPKTLNINWLIYLPGAQIVEEIARLHNDYYKTFTFRQNLPVYDPDKFQEFLQ